MKQATKRAQKFIVLAAALAFFAGSSLTAQAEVYPAPAYGDHTYKQCQTSADCVSFQPNCQAPVSVNRDAEPALNAYRQSTVSRYSCNVAKVNPYNAPACVAGLCTFMPARNIQRQNGNPTYCETGADCTIISDACGNKRAVATMYAGQQQVGQSKYPCAGKIDTRKVSELSCQYNQCTVLFDNYPAQ